MSSRGFVYVATGSGYLEEARRSAESVRHHHPDIPICLVTDRETEATPPFTHVARAAGRVEHKPIDKLLSVQAPFERCLFLDTDTFALDDVTPVFDLLDRFDLAVHQDVNRGWHYDLPDVPHAFTEFNTGVIAFRNTPRVQRFFQEWRRQYDDLQAERGMVNDQPAFRRALFHSELRAAPLPSEFHFLANFPNYALWKVRLIHARGDYAAMARDANSHLGGRAYIPNVGVVPSFAGRKGWLAATWRIFGRMARLLVRPPADSAAGNPRQWWRDERRIASERQSK